jgi:hypothetical protein
MEAFKFNPHALASLVTGETRVSGAPFTVRSKVTGKDYTFRIARVPYNGRWYSHVNVETGYLNFQYLGFYTEGRILRKGKLVDTPAALAAAWLLRNLENPGQLNAVDLFHTGRCLKCGRELTDAVSIEAGLGPVCIGK